MIVMVHKLKTETFEKLKEVLQLHKGKDGYYKTTWGNKTDEGLKVTIENILEDE